VALYLTLTGTQNGPAGPFPATGKQVEVKFLGIMRLENAKVAEIWVEWDNLSILTQLGHYPPATAE
jgi:predicted ester cyclase